MSKLLIAAICLVACVGVSSTAYANYRDWHGPNHPYYIPPQPPPPPPPPGPAYYHHGWHPGGYVVPLPPPPPPSPPRHYFHNRPRHYGW